MNRNDMYNTFQNEEFEYDYPISFELRNKDYLEMNNVNNIEWNYGDTASIIFHVIDNDEDIDLSNSEIKVQFKNFRYEVVYEEVFHENDINQEETTITVNINEETSKNIFLRGNYTCSMILTDQSGDVTTILQPENCIIYIK